MYGSKIDSVQVAKSNSSSDFYDDDTSEDSKQNTGNSASDHLKIFRIHMHEEHEGRVLFRVYFLID